MRAEAENPNSELTFKGVVFNQMKGAMSAPVSALWQTLAREVYPTTTYHHNSGGDPQQLRARRGNMRAMDFS